MHNEYFQGVLQLRKPHQEVLEYLERWLSKRKVLEVSQVKELKTGVDMYFVSNTTLLVIGKKLYEEFGGEIKRTSTLHTRDTKNNKDLHRGTILIKFPPFSKGDVLDVGGKPCKVKSIAKSVATCLDLLTGKGKKVLFVGKKLDKLEKFNVVVSKVRPSLEVLDPETFQSTVVENAKEVSEQSVKIVKLNGRIYLVE